MKPQATAVAEFASNLGVKLFKPENPEQFTAIEQLDNIDLLLVVAYGMRIPESAFNRPSCGCINIHYSMLPRWRGAAPVAYALRQDDKFTGVTIFMLSQNFDEGPILGQKECAISADDTSETLLDKLNLIALDMLPESMLGILQNDIEPTAQSSKGVTYAPRITTSDTVINWHNQSAKEIECMVRAMYPRPLARTTIASIPLLIHRAAVTADAEPQQQPSGSILHNKDNTIDIVAADRCRLKLLTVQTAGRRPLPIAEFMNGQPKLRQAQIV